MTRIKNIHILSIPLVIITMLSVIILFRTQEQETVAVSATLVSNEKICWGIRRNSLHEQPDVGDKNRKILEDNNGICLGDKNQKVIYITFDEGYEAGYTNKILDILKENNVKAAFFLAGHYFNSAGELVERMIKEGHIVGNHTPLTLMTLF